MGDREQAQAPLVELHAKDRLAKGRRRAAYPAGLYRPGADRRHTPSVSLPKVVRSMIRLPLQRGHELGSMSIGSFSTQTFPQVPQRYLTTACFGSEPSITSAFPSTSAPATLARALLIIVDRSSVLNSRARAALAGSAPSRSTSRIASNSRAVSVTLPATGAEAPRGLHSLGPRCRLPPTCLPGIKNRTLPRCVRSSSRSPPFLR